MSLMHSSIRLDTTTRATTGTIPALRARGWGVVWSGHVPDIRLWVARQIESNLFKSVFVKYIISRAVDKMAADSVAVERSLWNMSRQHTEHHVIDVNTLTQLHGQGEAKSSIIWYRKWCMMSRREQSVHTFILLFMTTREWIRVQKRVLTPPHCLNVY